MRLFSSVFGLSVLLVGTSSAATFANDHLASAQPGAGAFDDAAVKHLTGIANLQDLTLNYTKLGDKGFQQLLALPKVRGLYVDGTMVSKEVYQKAKKEHPKLRLYFYRYDQ
jgi:hypothetical protein